MGYSITVGNVTKEYPEGTRIIDVARDFENEYQYDIMLAIYNNRLKELAKPLTEDGHITFLTYEDKNGKNTYRRSVVFVMQKALIDGRDDIGYDIRVLHSLGKGYFCRVVKAREDGGYDQVEITDDLIRNLELAMREIVDADIVFDKEVMKTYEAQKMFADNLLYDKERLMRYRKSSNINMYSLEDVKDYFYGFMVYSTGCLKYFKLQRYADGFVILFPGSNPTKVAEFNPSVKLFETLQESGSWSGQLNISTVASLNDAIAQGRCRDIILMQEALMEERIGSLAKEIAMDPSRKFIMIAGPSSSGKTTFSHRLSTQLRARGLNPHPVPLDDYYLDRDQMPLDEFGEKDFEAIEGLDIERFNQDMLGLLRGERVELPIFNFKTGKREPRGRYMELGADDVLVIEGIHGLNERMSYALPDENKYKIYISALTQLSIDEHNPLSTSDGRLIRRIVRDSRTRGTSAAGTLAMWPSVRRGEEKNIFPYQDEADAMFNSALIYEWAVLKIYAQPQLYAIDKDDPYYVEANRLIKLLDYFLPMSPEDIANNSLIREFIGGGCFGL